MEKKFEEAIIELEGIIKELESGELSLDVSMEKFKQGVELSNICNKKLEQAEKSITQLIENTDGTVTEEKFEI
ncbi:MAG: exodeoxyribonuclease VII small subunit [Clostridiales bacterium]|nr:exodeoxyribonuclease VII small subunit [Clostridiales bacterium]